MNISLTGHREERLKKLGSEQEIKDWIKEMCINLKCTDAYCGMASGGDMLFAKTIIEFKQEENIKLHIIMPCQNYNSKHKDYNYILDNCDSIQYTSDYFYKGCDSVRDQMLVDKCDVLLALFDGIKYSGVYSTIRKVEKQGKHVIVYKEK